MSQKGYNNIGFKEEGTVNVMKSGLTEIIILHDNNAPVPNFGGQAKKVSNAFFSAMKNLNAEIRITYAVYGGGTFKFIANNAPAGSVKISVKDYAANGARNILDSVGNMIIEKGKAYAEMDESEHPENVIFAIAAFGRDNASKNFEYNQIADMIAHQSYVYKWQFFCGASEPGLAEQLGIPEESTFLIDTESEDFFKKVVKDLEEKIKEILNL
jgi:hypothetical protein